MDTDVTKEKDIHSKILEGFATGNIDVLVGTQMIAKGHDFPNVTLVGVISADTALNLADFRSSERTFHLLTQVSGRAGRGDVSGRVVIQTYNPNHYCLQDIKTNSFDDFYDREIQTREELFLPPFSKLIQVITKDRRDQRAKDAGDVLCCELQTLLRQTGSLVYGPAPMPVLFLKGKYRWAITIRLPLELWDGAKQKIWECIKRTERTTKVHFYVDVDPVSVL
jgi:primosomal protein N' (replication factor Y)